MLVIHFYIVSIILMWESVNTVSEEATAFLPVNKESVRQTSITLMVIIYWGDMQAFT